MKFKNKKGSTKATHLSVKNIENNQIFKLFAWASSITANASICRVGNPGSTLGSSTATNQ